MKVVVFGASGATGRPVVAQLLAQGHDVTAFVRTPAKLSVAHARLRVEQGNVADAAIVARAVAGQDAVISTLGVGTPLKHDQAVIQGVAHILQAMKDASVKRLIYMSFAGVRNLRGVTAYVIRPIVGFLLRHEIADHVKKEQLIRASQVEWTIVHAPKLTNGPATHTYRSGPTIESRSVFPTLSRADTADFIVGQLTDQRSIHQIVRVLP